MLCQYTCCTHGGTGTSSVSQIVSDGQDSNSGSLACWKSGLSPLKSLVYGSGSVGRAMSGHVSCPVFNIWVASLWRHWGDPDSREEWLNLDGSINLSRSSLGGLNVIAAPQGPKSEQRYRKPLLNSCLVKKTWVVWVDCALNINQQGLCLCSTFCLGCPFPLPPLSPGKILILFKGRA